MKKIKIWNDSPSESQVLEIADYLRQGGLAVIPTDSVYAIACDALDAKAIAALCKIKGINPEKNHLSVICDDISMASEYAHIDDDGYRILKKYLPGPFTFLFRCGRNLPNAFKKRRTVGIRIPSLATPREIVRALGHPLLCTSIEFEDSDHAREPELIAETYRSAPIDLIVEAGDGDEEFTTIVDCTDASSPVLLRRGKAPFPD